MKKETAMKYINAFYRAHCNVSDKIQPNFWDAVAAICENPECDVHSIGLIEGENCCINSYDDFPVYKHVPTRDVISYANQIAQEIITAESMSIDDAAFELFIIKKRLTVLEKKFSYMNSRYTLEY